MELQQHRMDSAVSTNATAKAAYTSPSLKTFGLVRDLTASGSKPGIENQGNTNGGLP
jgi:hypothetical protein